MGRVTMMDENGLRRLVYECVRDVLSEGDFERHYYEMPGVQQESEDRVLDALSSAGFYLHPENEGHALVDGMVFLSPSGGKWEITRVYGSTEYEVFRPGQRFWVTVDEGDLLGMLS